MASAQAMAEKLKSGSGFDLNDFLLQLQQMKKMGGLVQPARQAAHQHDGQTKPGQTDMDRAERDMRRMEASSMP